MQSYLNAIWCKHMVKFRQSTRLARLRCGIIWLMWNSIIGLRLFRKYGENAVGKLAIAGMEEEEADALEKDLYYHHEVEKGGKNAGKNKHDGGYVPTVKDVTDSFTLAKFEDMKPEEGGDVKGGREPTICSIIDRTQLL
jgi:hypothetical protein